jgi:hypothetical protein
MTDTTFELRPLDYGGLLDRSFELYKRNFQLFVIIAAVVYVPLTLMQIMLTSGAEGVAVASVATLGGLGALVAYVLSSGAILYAVSRAYLGHPPTLGECYSAVLSVALPLLWTWLLIGLMFAGIGIVLSIVMGVLIAGAMHGGGAAAGVVGFVIGVAMLCLFVFLALRVALVNQVVVLERISGTAAISRSTALAQNEVLRIFVMMLLVFALNFAITFAGSLVVGMLATLGTGAHVLQLLLNGALETVVYPFGMIVFTLLYYDIRIRKEAFDLQMLSSHVYQSAPPPMPAGHGMAGGYAASPGYDAGGGTPVAPHYGGAPTAAPPPPSSWGAPTAPSGSTPPVWGSSPAASEPTHPAPAAWGAAPPAVAPPPAPASWGSPPAAAAAPAAPVPAAPPASVAPPSPSTMIRCTACGAQSPADSAFCAECGHRMQ